MHADPRHLHCHVVKSRVDLCSETLEKENVKKSESHRNNYLSLYSILISCAAFERVNRFPLGSGYNYKDQFNSVIRTANG